MTWEAEVARRIAALLPARGPVRLAVSGGETPGPVYRELRGLVDWSRVEVFLCDERMDRSNEALVRETLAPPVLHPLTDPDEYERLLRPGLDAALLGIGEDGHTASLFPGTAALSETRRLCVRNQTPKGPRLTLTFPCLNAAAARVFLVRGKADVVAAVRAGADLPAARIRDPLWLVG